MKRKSSLAILFAATLYLSQPALPWGTRAHAVIDRTAIDTLPDDGPVFLKKYVELHRWFSKYSRYMALSI